MSAVTIAAAVELTPEQRALADTARDFAAEHLAPHAVDWDRRKHFPVDVLRKAAELGMGGLYVAYAVGGTGLGCADVVLVFEVPDTGCPSIAGYLSIHNMAAWMVDRYGTPEQRTRLLPGRQPVRPPPERVADPVPRRR